MKEMWSTPPPVKDAEKDAKFEKQDLRAVGFLESESDTPLPQKYAVGAALLAACVAEKAGNRRQKRGEKAELTPQLHRCWRNKALCYSWLGASLGAKIFYEMYN